MIPVNRLKSVEDIELAGKTVLMRVDFNVPMDEKGDIADDTRIRATAPTIRRIMEKGGKLILMSHMGRPKGQRNEKYSLLPCADQLSLILKSKVVFAEDCVGDGVRKLANDLQNGDVLLLENTRFHPGEEKNDDSFAKDLANNFNVYLTDAFGSLHRAHASTHAVARYFTTRGIGLLVKKELEYLNPLLDKPERPFTMILGGAKVSDKIGILENLVKVADKILIGGGMAYTFLKAKGFRIGKSLYDEAKESRAKRIMEEAEERGCKLILPKDHVVADKLDKSAITKMVRDNIPDDMIGLDIGQATIAEYSSEIAGSKTVFWNGPMGVFEMEPFSKGTFEIAKAVSSLKGNTIVGGGDSVAALTKIGCEKRISHLSTGGGATLEFLEGKLLPGLEVLLG